MPGLRYAQLFTILYECGFDSLDMQMRMGKPKRRLMSVLSHASLSHLSRISEDIYAVSIHRHSKMTDDASRNLRRTDELGSEIEMTMY